MEKGKHNLESIKNLLQLALAAFGVISILYSAFTYINGTINSFVDEDRLAKHNTDEKSHPSAIREIQDCEGKVEALGKRVEESHAVEVALGARLIRLIAADLETNKNLKMAASNYYEQEFRILIRKGSSVEEATLDALRQPWYSRPRGQM